MWSLSADRNAGWPGRGAAPLTVVGRRVLYPIVRGLKSSFFLPHRPDTMARLFVDQLTVLDFSCLHARAGLTGQSWIVDVEIGGVLDDQGMVQDFGEVKRRARSAVEAVADHRLVVPGEADGLTLAQDDEEISITYAFSGGRVEHRSPRAAVYVLQAPAVTMEFLRPVLEAAVREVVPANVDHLAVNLREEAIDGASYRYSHGLKAHDGLCQRIAHGHRSRLQVWRNGDRARELEAAWADRWRDIYLVSKDDVANEPAGASGASLRMAYTAREGRFELVLPKDRCELLPAETTVERIAQYIAECLKADDPGADFRVRAYEGVNKGALAEA
jgi:6-pyruvoyl-tetrahydropterin synthase